MKANQTFPKQMEDSDQEQLEDEAEVLRAVVNQTNPRHGCASRLLLEKTGYCSSSALGEPLSASSCPQRGDATKVGYQQGDVALRVTRVKMVEQK